MLLAISLVSTLNSMEPDSKSVIDKQNEDEQMAIWREAARKANNYKNARVLIPEELILQLHPDSREMAYQCNDLINRAEQITNYKEAAEKVPDYIKNNAPIPDNLILQTFPVLRQSLYQYNDMYTKK